MVQKVRGQFLHHRLTPPRVKRGGRNGGRVHSIAVAVMRGAFGTDSYRFISDPQPPSPSRVGLRGDGVESRGDVAAQTYPTLEAGLRACHGLGGRTGALTPKAFHKSAQRG